jgi:GrpB-like predicted nucleotidyltransferase (UPF0157 family)/DNA polymerase III epsilon subunit-like protein
MAGPTFQEYNNRWPEEFRKEQKALAKAFGDAAINIHHVGSTSIQGMPGKGIIDILVTVDALEPRSKYVDPLTSLGYIERPVPDRPESPFFTKPSVKPRTHNVHIALDRSLRERSMLSFRDYLCTVPEAAKVYENSKRQFATANPNDWEYYSRAKLQVADELAAKAIRWYFSNLKDVEHDADDEVYVSFDIEADGPIPGDYSMLSAGFCVAGWTSSGIFHPTEPRHRHIYLEIQPISNSFLPEAMKVNGLNRETLARTGLSPENAVQQLKDWFESVKESRNLVLVAYPATFDWPFLSYYFHKFGKGAAPPISFTRVCDLRTLIVSKSRSLYYTPTRKCIPEALMPARKLTHHALNDAVEQAELFASVQLWPGKRQTKVIS